MRGEKRCRAEQKIGDQKEFRSPKRVFRFCFFAREQRLSPQVRPKFRTAEFCVWPEAKCVFAKVRTCAGLLHNRKFTVSKFPAEKSESKTHCVFEREKPLPSFPIGKVNSGFSFKPGRNSALRNFASGRKQNLFSQKSGPAPDFCTIVALR